jgi:hypothetical protein
VFYTKTHLILLFRLIYFPVWVHFFVYIMMLH